MPALYNEIEPYAVEWLRNLSNAGHIARGDIDARSIAELTGADLAGREQAHFFAGIGVWSHALRLAGVPDTFPVWTGSCPCQPFSSAGKRGGFEDERHLWPEWYRLVRECRPPILFGEQVASPDGLAWLDTVLSDLETAGYAGGAVDLGAAGVGAPHIRQRLWIVAYDISAGAELRGHLARWMADDDQDGLREFGRTGLSQDRDAQPRHDADGRGSHGARAGGMVDSGRDGDRQHLGELPGDETPERSRGGDAPEHASPARARAELVAHDGGPESQGSLSTRDAGFVSAERGAPCGGLVAHAKEIGRGSRRDGGTRDGASEQPRGQGLLGATGRECAGFWRECDWIPCSDGKARPVEPGTFPLAHGATARVGRLRAYGNGIVSEVAQAVIESGLRAVAGILDV